MRSGGTSHNQYHQHRQYRRKKDEFLIESYKRLPVNAAFDAYLDEMDHAEAEVANQKPMLGYPLNCNHLRPLLPLRVALHRDFTISNCGDPFDDNEKPYVEHI